MEGRSTVGAGNAAFVRAVPASEGALKVAAATTRTTAADEAAFLPFLGRESVFAVICNN